MELPVLNSPVKQPPNTPFAKLRFRALQLQGKVRRFFRASIYTRDNEELLARRQGECTRCGACCKILIRCPFLNEDQGEYSCSIYGNHFAQCQIFPLVPKDLKELEEPCGYTFTVDSN